MDKIAKAAMSKEMLAAGLTAAAAAIAASPAARKKIRDAGLDAADTAQQAANNVASSAAKLGSLIAEAVAEAADRLMSGKWSVEGSASTSSISLRTNSKDAERVTPVRLRRRITLSNNSRRRSYDQVRR